MKKTCNVLVWNLPAGTTDITQPVDAGYGRAVKQRIGKKLAQWLEDEEHLQKWEIGALKASERRILLTIWVSLIAAVRYPSGELLINWVCRF